VTVAVSANRLRVTVTNPLPTDTPTTTPVSAGTGTAGMSERVDSLGGTFRAGPTDAATYEVEAAFPART
jgi:signal transduction histidine kinase